MSFIHPDTDMLPYSTSTSALKKPLFSLDFDDDFDEDAAESLPHDLTATQRPETVEIKIVLVKVQAESPLLPIKEDSPSETNNNNNNSSSSNNKQNHNPNTPNHHISAKGHHPYNAVETVCNSPAHVATPTANARKRSIGNLIHATPTLTPQLPNTPTANGCRRRSSTTSISRIEGFTPNHTSPATTTTTNTTTIDGSSHSHNNHNINSSNTNTPTDQHTSLNIDDLSNNNNNYTNGSLYSNYNYTTQAPPHTYTHTNSHAHTHTHLYNLYPKDSFSSLEGQAPRPNNKMETKVDAVGRITGEWGKWQLRTVLLIFLCKIPSSWFMACIIFTAPAPRHGEFFCKPPNTVGAQNQTLWIKVSHPQKEEIDDQEFSIDFCNVYQDAQQHAHHYYNYEQPELEPKIWEEPTSRNANVIPCQQFHHEAEFHSVITQYDLVCSRDILVSVTQFFHLFGVLTGGILANHLLKYFSPRNVMLFGMITQIFCGNLTGHVASYELHVFFRCLSAVCCAQMYTAGGMIMADITGGKYRTCVSTLFEQFWSIGVIMLPGVASFFQSWSHLYMAISWPTVILIYLWQWIPDSPRWMITRGRVLDAKKILFQCVEVNGTRHGLPHDIDQQLQLQAQTAMDAPPLAGWWAIWKGEKAVRHMVCVHLCWSIYIVVYYGMLLNIRSFSREHLEINTVIAGICEIIGTFIGLFLILKTTRKWVWTGLFNVVAGFMAILGWWVPHDIPINGRVALLMLSAMISKVAISTTLSILTTCTVELVSAEKKKICAFSTICWARFWLLGAPFIGATIVFGQLVPQMAFASLAIMGGLISCFIASPRTIAKGKTTSAATTPTSTTTQNNMATATQLPNAAVATENGIDNKAYAKGMANGQNNATPITHPIFTSITKMTTPNSNLPPQLMPGIWTTKSHEDSPPV